MNTKLNWSIRIFICALFLLSGIAKLFPIWAFEKQLVDIGGFFTWETAPYFSRALIGLELGIGFCFLTPQFTKRFVIPITSLLLVGFCIHLISQMITFGPMDGNCGCFGQLIPMTPLEAFLKNVLTLGLLAYLRKKIEDPSPKNFFLPLSIYLASTLIVFISFPLTVSSTASETNNTESITSQDTINIDTSMSIQSSEINPELGTSKKDSSSTKTKKTLPNVSGMISKFTPFAPKEFAVNQGEKLICLFLPGCEHCIETAKELAKIKSSSGLPPVHIIFMNEETFKIDDFFQQTNFKNSYSIADIPAFWKLMGANASTPGVVLLKDGKIIRFFNGTGAEQFNAETFQNLIQK
jgi:hypothetical protein